ncbi:MAG: hypothetical protein R6V46_03330 [Desulfatiglandaceae bacterium]|jgi:hypothetical protein
MNHKEGRDVHRAIRKSVVLMMLVAFVVTVMVTPATAEYYAKGGERTAMGMFGDLLLLRTLGFAAMVGGAAVFVVSLPFSLLGGNTEEAAQKLVVEPAKFTFVRPLGELPESGGY